MGGSAYDEELNRGMEVVRRRRDVVDSGPHADLLQALGDGAPDKLGVAEHRLEHDKCARFLHGI